MQASLPDDHLSMRKMASLDQLLADLQAKRRELADTLKQIDTAIKHVKDARQAVGGGLLDFITPQDAQDTAESESHPSQPRAQGVLSPIEVARHARSTLLDHGRPMKRGALVRAMLQRGVPLAGADKSKNLGTILWRQPDMFVHLEGLGYWPKDVPISGVYDPDI